MNNDSKLYDQIHARVLQDLESQINAGVSKEISGIVDRHEGNIGHLAGLINNLTQTIKQLKDRVDHLEYPGHGVMRGVENSTN